MFVNRQKKLALAATILAFVVVVLGAFTRLSDAGLGCPDWPGCYGFVHIPTDIDDIAAANLAFPEQPYELHKAWPEMVHRYFASSLGFLVLLLFYFRWKNQTQNARRHTAALLILVLFQGALGMWTVTLKLHPSIVMLHLLGGIATLSLLASLYFRYRFEFNSPISKINRSRLKPWAIAGLAVVLLQIALGGWTSSNYAALVCFELPICQSNWWAASDFVSGFQFWGHAHEHFEFGVLDTAARTAIHVAHRIGAIITTVFLAVLIYRLFALKKEFILLLFGWVFSGLLVTQLILGIINILYQIPLVNATAHNAVGALLAVTSVVLLTLILMPNGNQGDKV